MNLILTQMLNYIQGWMQLSVSAEKSQGPV
jgi:hypothetical protein